MDIKTISATLALLAGGVTLQACDDSKKPATEVDAAKDKPADKADADKADADKGADKVEAKTKEAAKGEMACGEGGCGAGGCGAKKGDHGDDKAVHAKGEEGDKAKEGDKPAEGEKAEKDKT